MTKNLTSQMRDVIQVCGTETNELSVKLAFLKVSIIKSMKITCIIFLSCPDFRLTKYAIPVRNMNVHLYLLLELT